MARTLVLDTITEPSNSGTANITLSSDTTTTMPKVDINSGAIDATTLGAATPSSVAATTLSASGNATLGGTLGVTGNSTLSGTGNNVGTITTGTWSGTEVAVAKGGTGATTGAAAITNLGVPQIIKYVHINGTTYRVYDTANTNYHYVVHDAISYSVVSGRSYRIEAQGLVAATDIGDAPGYAGGSGTASIGVRLHASPTNRSQGDNVTWSGGGYDGVIKSSTVSISGNLPATVKVHTPIHMVGLYTATATTTHYTYFSMKGTVATNGFYFLLTTADDSGTHPTSGTDNDGVFCSFIITEIPSGVTLTNQDAS